MGSLFVCTRRWTSVIPRSRISANKLTVTSGGYTCLCNALAALKGDSFRVYFIRVIVIRLLWPDMQIDLNPWSSEFYKHAFFR